MNPQIINSLKKFGWAEIKLSDESLKYQNDLISYSDTLAKKITDEIVNKNSFNEVIKVSAIRSILRFSNQSKNFVKSIAQDLIKNYPLIKEFYITPPYIINHQPNEKLQEGGFHSDTLQYCGKLYTSWTPINNYSMDYPALSLINKSHKYHFKIIYKILCKIKFNQFIDKLFRFLLNKPHDLIVKENFTYFWHSDLLHKGNQNKTNKSHVALVVRVSEKPLYYEPTVKLSEIIKIQNLTNYENNISYDQLTLKLFEMYEIAKGNIDIIKYSSNLKDTADKNFLRHLSFASSILAQKLNNNFSSNLDLMSFIIAKENLVSLERFLLKFKNKDISNEVLNKFFIDKDLSYQEALIINKFKEKNLDNLKNQKKISWLD